MGISEQRNLDQRYVVEIFERICVVIELCYWVCSGGHCLAKPVAVMKAMQNKKKESQFFVHEFH